MANPTGAGVGRPLVDKYGAMVKAGAKAFLVEEYKWLFVFVVVLGLILLLLFTIEEQTTKSDGVRTAFAFFLGAALSASAGWLGMMVATDGNTRTTAACAGKEVVDAKTGEVTGTGTLNDGLRVAFTAGAVMGFVVVGLGLLGVGSAFLVVAVNYSKAEALQVLAGFGFGASSIALFARVAGGIYTKAADVGADLVGKVEAGIDEDDPHNPAVIADNVGDNVGDVAGMGADLFESYVGSIIAAATLAPRDCEVALPFWLAGAGVLASLIGTFAVSTKEKGEGWNSNLGALMWALEKGTFLAGATFLGLAAACCHYLGGLWGSYLCVIIGLATGVVIGKLTEYFTSFDFAPVQSIKARGSTGPATVVIQGLGVGMLSCVPTIFVLVAAILGCAAIKGEYGIAIAAVGMLATLGITLATDAYGPVADNAGGLAEMDPAIPDSVRQITDSLDALGNTTAATGKGFAIGSAVLTSLSLLAAFKNQAGLDDAQLAVTDPYVLSGALFGAMLPYMFAALTMISVGKAAAEIICEVRDQFHNRPDLVAADGKTTLRDCIMMASNGEKIPPEMDVAPDSNKCVEISTRSSVREMVAPGAYAILAPLFVGFLVGPACLVGMLSGAICSGAMVAIMMSNAGGAWDNSKKFCEKDGTKGLSKKKNADGSHKFPAKKAHYDACVVGDTVGDPFKDTSGPALNILIKLMSMVSLTVAPLLKAYHKNWDHYHWGFIPFGLFVIVTYALVKNNILTWQDPIQALLEKGADQADEETGALLPPKEVELPEKTGPEQVAVVA
ncbi:putative proton translocating inorganic pyrophosphatase [Aureococcus anophagefferens]|uniref:H(+)-exporting diphosphatase n=1 Tax=Aureococcus anophagefferens TaxID=44056 RepID=F0YDX9_AURAN|nr:putative proton translocating inorganic pyrophosphatase [Aureococcus anophagefferens]EGB06704.1 putative proton translocating inorganic pyrophosphatase [Aureococcus anophagefferens]|eukprot:XP_009038455.1 putative proton translocating inorganic pyrophosphatase [Aureococcus anophagefferens]